MRALLFVLVLASCGAEAEGSRYRTRDRARPTRCTTHPTDPGCPRASATLAFFEAFPSSGAGTSGACSTTAPTGAKGEALTFTRASVAECYSNDGQTLTQLAANQPRVSSGTATSSWLGLWVDPDAINSALYGRDLSQAAWTKTSMTCSKTATGMRSDANGASTCTATAANATVCQSLVFASAVRTTSWHIKRRTGTGAVTFTRDNFTSSTADVASRLSSTLWRRVVPREAPGCAGGNCIIDTAMSSSVLNPVICLKLATSGDAVDIDFVQDEASERATSPVETAGTAMPRSAEVATFAFAGRSVFSMSVLAQVPTDQFTQYDSPAHVYFNGNDMGGPVSAQGWSIWAGIQCVTQSAANTIGSIYSTGDDGRKFPVWSGTFTPFACSFGLGSLFNSQNAGRLRTSGTGYLPSALTNVVRLGQPRGSGRQWGGVVKGVKLGANNSSGLWTGGFDGTLPIAWLGDSVTEGDWAYSPGGGDRPPDALTKLRSKAAYNFGLSGDTAAGCLSRWRSQISGRGFGTLVLLCGVNSVAQDVSAAAAFADLQTIMDEARAQGMLIIPVGLTPWKNATSPVWTAGRQTVTNSLNALISAYATTNGLTFVSTASLGGEGGDPDVLLAAYQAGGADKIHLSVAGALALATLVAGANP